MTITLRTKVLQKVKKILQSYDVDDVNGFLRDHPPLRSIPLDKYPKYAIWEQVMEELPQLIIAQVFAKKMAQIPIITNISDLLSAELDVKRRAITILSFFANAFMNETQIVDYPKSEIKPKPRDYLPECIAIPLYQLCKDMNAPPIIRHCHMVLNNWRLLFPPFNFNKKRHDLSNLALNNLFLGGIDENWFFCIGFGIESCFGSLLTSMLSIQELVQIINNKHNHTDLRLFIIKEIKCHLRQISDDINEMTKYLLKYYSKLDGHIFYRRVRIFVTGCESEKDFPFGVELRGIPKSASELIGSTKIENHNTDNLCLRYNGASAARK